MFSVEVDPKSLVVIAGLKRIARNRPVLVRGISEEFGASLKRRVRTNITVKKLIWTGRLHGSVEWVQTRDRGALYIANHGRTLQEERPRREIVREGSLLHKWVYDPAHHKNAGRFPALESKVAKKLPINLRRYDVWETPLRNTAKDIPKIAQRALTKYVNSRGVRAK